VNQPMHTYSYSVLRFTPDIRTGEFVNVGIAAFSPSNQLALIRCRDSIARITKLNHLVDGYGVVKMLKAIAREFRSQSLEVTNQLEFEKNRERW